MVWTDCTEKRSRPQRSMQEGRGCPGLAQACPPLWRSLRLGGGLIPCLCCQHLPSPMQHWGPLYPREERACIASEGVRFITAGDGSRTSMEMVLSEESLLFTAKNKDFRVFWGIQKYTNSDSAYQAGEWSAQLRCSKDTWRDSLLETGVCLQVVYIALPFGLRSKSLILPISCWGKKVLTVTFKED